MPRLPDNTLDVAIYCYGSEPEARDGKQAGGSGFLLGVRAYMPEPVEAEPLIPPRPPEPKLFDTALARWFCYAVTCKHVAKKAPVIRLNRYAGGVDIIPLRSEDWHCHDDYDLAIVAIEPKDPKTLMVPVEILLTPEESETLDVGIGDDVYSVGRFINHEGRQTNRPSVRFGNISVMPADPVIVKGIGPQEAYLVETRTIPGYSGSPVFLEIHPWELQWSGELRRNLADKGIPAVRLLGVSGGYLYRNEPVQVRIGGRRFDGWRAESNSGMMWCIPSWKLLELLNDPKIQAQRAAQRRIWQQHQPGGAPA